MLAEAAAFWLALHGPAMPDIAPHLPGGAVVYRPDTRSTSNWRLQALGHLTLSPQRALAFATGMEPARLPRCIRLNNYWCIKKAGWTGEVASDSEGHVAFSSSLEGAMVAVRLLRRYYIDYGRKSALAIVSRWAPAQCKRAVVSPGRRTARRSGKSLRGLAPRGIDRTLRARFLARHGRGGVARSARAARKDPRTKRPKLRRSRVTRSRIPYRPVAMMRAPSLTPGGGEKPQALAPLAYSVLPPARIRPERTIPRIGCTSEAIRIRNYAGKISSGLVADSKTDLQLFNEDGSPGPNLARVLAQMAAVEIGPYRIDRSLIEAAIKADAANGNNAGKNAGKNAGSR